MPRKIKKIKQKQKQKQSQKVVVNINTTKKSYNRKQQPSKSNLPSNNNKVPAVIVNLPSYNQPNNPAPNSVNNELLRMLNQNQENMNNALLRRVEPQRELMPPMPVINPPIAVNTPPTNPLLSGIAEYKENPLLSGITEHKENPLLSSIAEPKENELLSTITQPKPMNFMDEMKQAILKKAAGETLTVHKLKKPSKTKPNESESLQTNALLEKIQPNKQFDESLIEKAIKSRRQSIENDDGDNDEWTDSGSYNENALLPVAKKIDDDPISVDEAKAIATDATEAGRMVREQSKINKENAYNEYKELGGTLPLTKDLGTKTINQNIEAIKEREELLNNNATNDEYKNFLTKNDVKGISKLNKEQLIDRVKSLIF